MSRGIVMVSLESLGRGAIPNSMRRVGVCGSIKSYRQFLTYTRHTRQPAACLRIPLPDYRPVQGTLAANPVGLRPGPAVAQIHPAAP